MQLKHRIDCWGINLLCYSVLSLVKSEVISMRGTDAFTESPFMVHCLDDFVPSNHPLRPIRQMVREVLARMDGLFAGMYEV